MPLSPHMQYLNYIAKYLGIAFVSGSIVHMGTLEAGAARYLSLLAIGLCLMVFGSLQEARANGKKIGLSYFCIVIGLSIATGLLSGGVQHYLDNPAYAGWLVGIGLLATYLAFFWKEKFDLGAKGVLAMASCAAVVVLLSVFAIEQLGPALAHGDTGHSH